MDRAENYVFLHNFHDFPSSLVKQRPLLSFDNLGVPLSGYRNSTPRVTFAPHAELLLFSHEDSPLHLFQGPGQILLQTVSCVMPDYGHDPDMPTDDASLPTVRRMTHTNLLSVPCLTRSTEIIGPSLTIISTLASLGEQSWFPLPRSLPYGGLPPEPPVTILLHLLSKDDPRLSLDMDDT